MAYIKMQDVMKICEGYSKHCFHSNDANGQDIADRILDDVVNLPTADVVEVVMCKDCKHMSYDGACYKCFRGIYSISGYKAVNLYDFCSYGERKEL